MKDLGDRMKRNYESRSQTHLTRRMPVIIRVDGRVFHTFTRRAGFEQPFSATMWQRMSKVARGLLEEIAGAKLAYIQSDEVSVLVTDFDRLNTEAWFDYNVQKLCSVSAAVATTAFNGYFPPPTFDARCFNIPFWEVVNYFLWRQKDWERNSLQMLARHYYSHKQLLNKGHSELHELIHQAGDNWANLDLRWKRGTVYCKEDHEPLWPLFNEERTRLWIEELMKPLEEED